MGKSIAIVNQKGGVGKTTSCVNLAAALTALGTRVLVCDFDPQGNATSGFGLDKSRSPSVYDVILGDAPMSKAVVSTKWGGRGARQQGPVRGHCGAHRPGAAGVPAQGRH